MDKNKVKEILSKINYPGFKRDIISFGMVSGVEINADEITINLSITSQNDEKKLLLVEDIKKQFTANTFEIVTLGGELQENDIFTIVSRKDNNYHIKLKEGKSAKAILESILKDTEIISFKKETPTMEDIFIKAVNNA